jgi:hypothetical protein
MRKAILLVAVTFTLSAFAASLRAADDIPKKFITFNDNGAWCWYQDERVVIDPANNTMLISSVACSDGADGKARSGDIDLTVYQFATGQIEHIVLHAGLQPQDDHNAAALLIRPDGRYLAVYTRHNQDRITFYRISERPHDASAWRAEQTFDWSPHHAAARSNSKVTYSNLFYLSAEDRTYNFARAINDDPSFLVSKDQGDTWTYGGKLLTEPKLGYVNGYTKYASNGSDRIDFVTTDHHPRDFNNSIYHGYVKGGKLFKSDGTVVDQDLLGNTGHPQSELTKIFAANSVFGGETMTHAWTMDIHISPDGKPCALVSCRANDIPEKTNFNDHRFFYCRFDGSAWKAWPLAKAGARLWNAEEDYTGLAALDPNDLNTVYVSSTIDPRTNDSLKFHEIFKGITADAGQTWKWTSVTENSATDNLRPIVPISPNGNFALLWFRGEMSRSQHYNCQVVGWVKPAGK